MRKGYRKRQVLITKVSWKKKLKEKLYGGSFAFVRLKELNVKDPGNQGNPGNAGNQGLEI